MFNQEIEEDRWSSRAAMFGFQASRKEQADIRSHWTINGDEHSESATTVVSKCEVGSASISERSCGEETSVFALLLPLFLSPSVNPALW